MTIKKFPNQNPRVLSELKAQKVQEVIPFVLSPLAGFKAFAVLTVAYMDNFSYLSEGNKTSLPTWNTAAILFSAVAGYGIGRYIVFMPGRKLMKLALDAMTLGS